MILYINSHTSSTQNYMNLLIYSIYELFHRVNFGLNLYEVDR